MDKNQKVEVINNLKDKFQRAKGVIMTEYKGLSVNDITELRGKLQNIACEYKVVKNTLTRLAIGEMGIEGLKDFLNGPTAIAFEYGDTVTPAKIIYDFQREHENLKVKVGVLGKKILSQTDIKSLASLPSRDVLISLVLARMKLPISGMVNVLGAPLRKLVNVLDAISKQKA